MRIVDKTLPQLAHLAPEFDEACSQSKFVQADAARDTSMARIFDKPASDPHPTQSWDFVFNLGGETAWSQNPEIYKLRSTQSSIALATEASKRQVKAFVEVSTGIVYSSSRTPRKESDKLKPWLKIAKAKLEAEEALSRIPGLNLVILRLAHVYGEYDHGFIAKALCLARIYQEQNRELKWLWTDDLRINTVHVSDVIRALWRAAQWRSENNTVTSQPSPSTSRRPSLMQSISNHKSNKSVDGEMSGPGNVPTFNIVDHGATSQGQLAGIISTVFSIKTGFQGSLISNFAKMNLENVVDDLNEDILQPWAELLAKNGITRPGPLNPYLEKELLKDTDLSLDGSLFERITGFTYQKERFNEDGVREMIDSYKRMGWWP